MPLDRQLTPHPADLPIEARPYHSPKTPPTATVPARLEVPETDDAPQRPRLLSKEIRDRLESGKLSLSPDTRLGDVHPNLRALLRGKRIARTSVHVCASGLKPVAIMKGANPTIERFFENDSAASCDTLVFTDGSIYSWHEGKERYKLGPSESHDLAAAGLFRGSGEYWHVTPETL